MIKAKVNEFSFKSAFEDIQKELIKGEKKQRSEAAKHFKKAVQNKIVQMGLVKTGNLKKAVTEQSYNYSSLIGMDAKIAPHALLVEYGSYMSDHRETKGKGHWRKGIRTTGKMPAKEYFLPTFREELTTLQTILSKDWLPKGKDNV